MRMGNNLLVLLHKRGSMPEAHECQQQHLQCEVIAPGALPSHVAQVSPPVALHEGCVRIRVRAELLHGGVPDLAVVHRRAVQLVAQSAELHVQVM